MQGFLVTTCDSFMRVMDSLTNVGVSVNNESKDGNFIILDAPKDYQIGTFGPISLHEASKYIRPKIGN
jgi:hypothetical protein